MQCHRLSRRRCATAVNQSHWFLVCFCLTEIHPLPPRDKSLSSAKFGRDSSSRHQLTATGYDSASSGGSPHRYVTSRNQTSPIDYVTSSTTSRHSRSALSATATLVLLLQTTACYRQAPQMRTQSSGSLSYQAVIICYHIMNQLFDSSYHRDSYIPRK